MSLGIAMFLAFSADAGFQAYWRDQWAGWHSEYILVGSNEPSEALLNIFPHRIVTSGIDTTLQSKLETDTGRSITVRHKGDAYWLQELPLFKPDATVASTQMDEHECHSNRSVNGFQIRCRHLNAGTIVRSEFRDGFGLVWFEYYCGWNYRTCQYKFRSGSPIFGPRMIAAVEKAKRYRN